jgi:hypothetical protein
VIKFVSDLLQDGGTLVSSTNKTDRHDITELLLKVALNTIKQTNSAQGQNMVLYFPQNMVLYFPQNMVLYFPKKLL